MRTHRTADGGYRHSNAMAVADLLAQITLDHTEAAVCCPEPNGPAEAGFWIYLAGQRFMVGIRDAKAEAVA